ncbi:hypothetical protein AMK16_16735 [Streptomyces sp. CB00455]|uniref:hypothetical protein n=1 Tax=Streptomyces sp. CB00455 TaxID=1703927 RepID=UPI0009400FCB|nr:hypothetical protein [Streptomyces sp. CB00455]OKK19704.1 hypothetical protein AMK16_16735 [Streptomyces sp. CB00455]
MPRPTAAQLAYGSATVVVSTIAMLLLSQTSTGLGIGVISVAALALGLLVAVTVPLPGRRGHRATRAGSAPATTGSPAPASARPSYGNAPAAARVSESRTAAAEHSVHH